MNQHYRKTDVSYEPTYWPAVWPEFSLALGRFVIACAGTGAVILLAWLTTRAWRCDR